MRRPVVRALMVVVGLSTLAVYLAGTYLAYLLVSAVWAVRPSPWTVAASLVVLTLVFAYVSYQVGTASILHGLDVDYLPPSYAPELYRRLEAYSGEMGVAPPDILVAEMGQANALAVGGGFGAGQIVVDRRLFGLLSTDELSGILAHELAHIERKDSLVQTFGYSLLRTLSGLVVLALAPLLFLVVGLARAVAWIRGRPGAWAETLPGRVLRAVDATVAVAFFALTLALLAHSRRREFAADDRAAAVTGDPLALARALRKIELSGESPWRLLSPLYVARDEEEEPLVRMLSTHPDTDERIDRLRERARRSATGRRIEVR